MPELTVKIKTSANEKATIREIYLSHIPASAMWCDLGIFIALAKPVAH
jgi:hypothetical protein